MFRAEPVTNDAVNASAVLNLKIAVGIATRGRPEVLADTISDLDGQDRKADHIVVAYADVKDIGAAPARFPDVVFIQSALGLTRQRNAILDQTRSADILVFLDDDFYVDHRYLANTERFFAAREDVVVSTGRVLADGIGGPGLKYAEAKAILSAQLPEQHNRQRPNVVFNAYGCNMCIRLAPVQMHHLRFDEQLPLYGWYEDVDFSRQLARFGTVMHMPDALGVHLGAKSGRTSGVRLGYSQIANPIYLLEKGTFPWSHMIYSITVRFLKNIAMSVRPESYVDRRGRLRGNLLGLRDLMTGELNPARVLNL